MLSSGTHGKLTASSALAFPIKDDKKVAVPVNDVPLIRDQPWMSRGLNRGRGSMVVPVVACGGSGGGARRGGGGRERKGGLTMAEAAQRRTEELKAMMAELALSFQEVRLGKGEV